VLKKSQEKRQDNSSCNTAAWCLQQCFSHLIYYRRQLYAILIVFITDLCEWISYLFKGVAFDYLNHASPKICQLLFQSNSFVSAEQTLQMVYQEILWAEGGKTGN